MTSLNVFLSLSLSVLGSFGSASEGGARGVVISWPDGQPALCLHRCHWDPAHNGQKRLHYPLPSACIQTLIASALSAGWTLPEIIATNRRQYCAHTGILAPLEPPPPPEPPLSSTFGGEAVNNSDFVRLKQMTPVDVIFSVC